PEEREPPALTIRTLCGRRRRHRTRQENLLKHLTRGNKLCVRRFHPFGNFTNIVYDSLRFIQCTVLLIVLSEANCLAYFQSAAIRRDSPCDNFEQSCLTRSVRADDADPVAGLEHVTEAVEQNTTVVRFGDIV